MRLSIGEAAERLGVSVRTLRWYDEIGLVSPAEVGENGYRYYDREALALLQQAIFYRELGLSLKDIKPLLQAPEDTRRRALLAHRQLLELKKQQLEGLLALVPGCYFGTEGFMRLSYCYADDVLKEGMDRLEKFIKSL